MKKKISLFILFLMFVFVTGLTACGGNETPDDSGTNTPGDTETNDAEIAAYKSQAISTLDSLVHPAIENVLNVNAKIHHVILNYYNSEIEYINGISDIDTAKEAANKVVEDSKLFIKDSLKPEVIKEVNKLLEPIIAEVNELQTSYDHEIFKELSATVDNFYNSSMEIIESSESINDIVIAFNSIKQNTNKLIDDEREKIINTLKSEAIEELDAYVSALIAKLPYDELKDDIQAFYDNEKEKLAAVDTIDDIEWWNEDTKKALENFLEAEIAKLNSVS